MGKPFLDQMGGTAAIDVAVGVFYRKLQTDSRINHFFDDIDARMLKAMQKDFLIMAMGGPNGYTAKELRAAHAHLLEKGLNETHVDTVVEHLKSTLEELRVPIAIAAQILATANNMRGDVFSRQAC
jgi:hemoglobin